MTTTDDREARNEVACTLMAAIDGAAGRLRGMPDTDEGIAEDILARDIIAAIPDGDRGAALAYLCWDRANLAATPDFLLDECAESTYETLDVIAAALASAIRGQGREDYAMREIASGEIRRLHDLERDLRAAGLAS